jgi:pilus assembly protein CpaF
VNKYEHGFQLIITEKGGKPKSELFQQNEITIGRVQGNDVVLPKGNVSKRHCRIAAKDGRVLVTDLQSTNGTYVNGRRITAPHPVRPNDRIYLGDFVLQVSREAEGSSAARTLERVPVTEPAQRVTQPQRTARLGEGLAGEEAEATPVPEAAADTPRPAEASEASRVTLVGPAGAKSTLVGLPGTPDGDETPPAEPASRATLIAPGGAPAAPVLEPEAAAPAAAGEKRPTAPLVPQPRRPTNPLARAEPRTPSGPMATLAALRALQRELYDRVVDSADLRLIESERLGEAALRARAEQAIAAAIREMTAQGPVGNSMDRLTLQRNVLRELVGTGPLEPLLADDDVAEILVDRADQIQVVRGGQRQTCEEVFSTERAAHAVIDRLLRSAGARPDDGPLLDLRLPDGARLTAVLPPLALRGPAVAIRKRRRQAFTLDDLVAQGALSSAMADLLWAAAAARKNVLVSGAAGSGKTTLLSALAAFLPPEERVICVEDVEELQPAHDLWLQIEVAGGESPRDVLRTALRMRPDRMVLGEVRGPEALELVQAMRTGLSGSLATVFAGSPRDALERLAQWLHTADGGLDPRAARELVAAAVHLVVHMGRFSDGIRRVTQICEVCGPEIDLRDVFVYQAERFSPTGKVPAFVAAAGGSLLDESIFAPD